MITWYYNYRIGDVYARCADGKVRKSNIFGGGGTMCVFTHFYKNEDGEEMEQMLNLYLDEKHIQRIMKQFGKLKVMSNVTCIRLNTFYKESLILAKYLTKSGYKVTLFYKERK